VLIVVDTNVLLVSVSPRSKYNWLYQLIISEKVEIAVTHDILMEYEEQLLKHWSSVVANNVFRSLLELPTLKHVSIFYNLRLIVADKDDDKFVDCAFAANADYIITNDHHFDVLKTIGFPNIPTLKLDELRQFLLKNRHNIALTLRQAQWYIDRQPPIRRFLIF